MKVLLTGAAGSVGYEVLKQLVEINKYIITVLDLPTKENIKKLEKYKDKVEIVYGSINDKKLLTKVVKNKDAIIHLAALIPPLADAEPIKTREVNYLGSVNIINEIESLKKKPFLIFASSVSVYGDRLKNYNIKVEDKMNPSDLDHYGVTKAGVEEVLNDSNIPFTIFRLTGVMGRPNIDPLMFHMPLETKLEIISDKDAARAFVNALDHLKDLKGNTYNVGGGKSCRTTYRDFINNMFKIYGLNPKYLNDNLFAEHNFHCGYLVDSYKLNDIINFQQDTLEDYYKRVDKETNKIIKVFTKILSKPIIYFLAKKSIPNKARKTEDQILVEHFFRKK